MAAAGGGSGVTVRELAAAAGVTVPTIYNLVGSKEHVVAAIIGAALTRLEGVLAAMPEMRGIERARAIVEESLQLFFSERATYRAAFRLLQEAEGGANSSVLADVFGRAADLQRLAAIEARQDAHLCGDLDPLFLGQGILHAFLTAQRYWALGAFSDQTAAARALYGLYSALLADATPAGRALILPRLRAAEGAMAVQENPE